MARTQKAEEEAKEKKKKITEIWNDRNRYKDISEAQKEELTAARQGLEEVNRQIQENDRSLAALSRKLVDARLTAMAWAILEEDRTSHHDTSTSTPTYEVARISLTSEALEAYLLQRADIFFKVQPDLKAIVEEHRKLLSPAVSGTGWVFFFR